ncbi:MAG: DNA polymerase/3'-5' exonuclease PolX [Planctomycetes bacterium]|nr:DNA polymerase/3'-5' exonuclease PolX [Planctomycetota bacterium]
MRNKDVSAVFDEIADLLEITGEQSFRVNSYRRAARTIKSLTKDIDDLHKAGGLGELPGIGKSMAAKIEEYLTAGHMALHAELMSAVPVELPKLLGISGMGPKKVALAWKELNVTGLDDLKRVIASGEFAKLKGMGAKSVEQIAKGLELLERSSGRTPLGIAWPLADELAEAMRGVEGVRRVEIAGSLRRGCETIGDLDLLCDADDRERVVTAFTRLPQCRRVLASGETKGSILVERRDGGEIQVDCRVVPTESFGAALQYFTGSKEHNVRLREMASKRGWKLNEWGLFEGETRLAGDDEAAIYEKMGVAFVPPEMREDRGEFDLKSAEAMVEIGDIRGDLHCHTTASDGTADAITMAQAACDRGYEYVAITDHSKSSAVANGLTIDRMWRQIEMVKGLNKKLDKITVLVGCECDILADGTLDYPDNVLAACDFVVASVHSSMKQDRDRVTKRVIDAMSNPNVSLLGHPTTRLIGRREPMDLNMEAVVAAAAETGTALELNASWQRLDLCDLHVRMAVEAGVKICIDTDAHSTAQFDQMKFGIATARRGWVKTKDVLNTMPLPSLRKWVAKKRKV